MAPQLTSLFFSRCRISNSDLIIIANSCPLLEELSLEECLSPMEPSDEIDGLQEIFIRCTRIKYLDLEFNPITDECLAHIPSQLLYLNLARCDTISSTSMFIIAERCTNLETLILNRYEDPTSLNQWLSKLTKLRFFEFCRAESSFIDYPSLDLSHMKDLEVVEFQFNKAVTLETLESLQHCSNLKALNLQFVYNEGDWKTGFEILKKFKALKYCSLRCFFNFNGLMDFVQHSQIKVC